MVQVSIPLYVQEAAYDGNIGMMELAKFYMAASDAEKRKLQDAIKSKRFKEAWSMVQSKTGVKLKGKEFATEGTVIHVPSRFKSHEDRIAAAIHKAHGSPKNHDIEVSFNNSGKREVHVDGKKHPQLTQALNKTLEMKEEVVSEDVGQLDEYASDLDKMKKSDSYKVGDRVMAKAGGKWNDAIITKPKNPQGNYGIRLTKVGVNYLASDDQLRLVSEDASVTVASNSVANGGVDLNPTGVPKWDKRSKFHIDHLFRRADGTKYMKKHQQLNSSSDPKE